jgi:hypothetical protein
MPRGKRLKDSEIKGLPHGTTYHGNQEARRRIDAQLKQLWLDLQESERQRSSKSQDIGSIANDQTMSDGTRSFPKRQEGSFEVDSYFQEIQWALEQARWNRLCNWVS